ncbi:hypothetical protein TNCV_2579111 [Trichonephila clavipes]|nr:hypothetical protein TNCV_2579111 [Trichonephila clavipes]
MLSKQGLKSKRLEKKGEQIVVDAKKGEDEVIIVSSDAEDEILIPALQEYVPELALLRVTRENLINAQKNSEEIKPLYEQAASQVQVTNQVYSLEKELLVKIVKIS